MSSCTLENIISYADKKKYTECCIEKDISNVEDKNICDVAKEYFRISDFAMADDNESVNINNSTITQNTTSNSQVKR